MWDINNPKDTDLAGRGAEEIRAIKTDLKDILIKDHNMEGALDPLLPNCDGYHSKVTLNPMPKDPTPLGNSGILYAKSIANIIELFYMNNKGVSKQLTGKKEFVTGTKSLLEHTFDFNIFNQAPSITKTLTVKEIILLSITNTLYRSLVIGSNASPQYIYMTSYIRDEKSAIVGELVTVIGNYETSADRTQKNQYLLQPGKYTITSSVSTSASLIADAPKIRIDITAAFFTDSLTTAAELK